MTCLGIIDYGAGNLQSVRNSLLAAGEEGRIVRSPADLEGITHLVLPGVGAFGDCSRALRAQGLDSAITSWIAADKPFLGICIGYQILFECSEESPEAAGLGIFKGKVRRFSDVGLKIPHMGWNPIHLSKADDPIWTGMQEEPQFYFVHSFFPEPADESLIAARCDYADNFAAAIRKGKLVATQFHPEKSQKLGLELLSNFLKL
ncbi:MAG: imidazole glycerol phosphate synthase subunit HisH [Akkermansia sp.]